MNTPKLRFKEFNDVYKYRNLSDISTLIKDGTHGTHENYENGIPLLSAKDINNNKIKIPEDCRKISVDDYNKIYKNYLLKEDDILLTIVGSIGRTALYKNEKVAFQRSVAIIRIDDNNNPNYIRQYIESPIIINQLNNMTNSSAQGGVYLNSLSKLNFDIPRKEEQLKVSKFLSLLDKKIELQSKKVEDLKLFKKGLIKDFYNEYNLRKIKIKEIGKIVTGTTPSKSINSYWDNGNITWVTPTDINNSRDINDSFFKITDKGLNKGKFIPKNSVLVTCIASIGKNAILKVDGSCNQQINAIIPNKNFNYNYVYYLIESISNYMKSIAGTSATSIINKEEFSKIIVKVHSKEKQDYIASVLSQFEIKILLEISKLNKFYQLKKGLMQNMFV